MKVRVKFSIEGHNIDEVMEAKTAEELLLAARDRVAKQIGWKGMFLKAMPAVTFAQEAVKRYNEGFGKSYPLPQTPEEFLKFGEATGYMTVLES